MDSTLRTLRTSSIIITRLLPSHRTISLLAYSKNAITTYRQRSTPSLAGTENTQALSYLNTKVISKTKARDRDRSHDSAHDEKIWHLSWDYRASQHTVEEYTPLRHLLSELEHTYFFKEETRKAAEELKPLSKILRGMEDQAKDKVSESADKLLYALIHPMTDWTKEKHWKTLDDLRQLRDTRPFPLGLGERDDVKDSSANAIGAIYGSIRFRTLSCVNSPYKPDRQLLLRTHIKLQPPEMVAGTPRNQPLAVRYTMPSQLRRSVRRRSGTIDKTMHASLLRTFTTKFIPLGDVIVTMRNQYTPKTHFFRENTPYCVVAALCNMRISGIFAFQKNYKGGEDWIIDRDGHWWEPKVPGVYYLGKDLRDCAGREWILCERRKADPMAIAISDDWKRVIPDRHS